MADRFWGIAYYRLRGPDARKMAEASAASGFEVVEELPSCERVLVEASFPAPYAREADRSLRAYLAEERISFIETREPGPPEIRRLTCASRDTKKRILWEAALSRDEASELSPFVASLVLGSKASLASWLARASYPARRSASMRFLDYRA